MDHADNPVEEPYLGMNCQSPYSRSEIFMRYLWLITESTVFRLIPRPFHTLRALLLKAFGAKISAPGQVVIFGSVRIMHPWKLTLHPHAMVGPGVILYNPAEIEIRRGANITQNVHLCTGTHDFQKWSMPVVSKPIVIEENAWIGCDCFVGPGVTVGRLCIIGARSVVVKSMPEMTVCAGSPCRVLKPRKVPILD